MRPSAVILGLASFALTGCSLTGTAPPSAADPVTGAAIHGIVHGGQQPVGGAHLYLFAAGTGGYGGNGIAASSSNASSSVFTLGETGQSDSVGPYILTTSNGNFTFPTYSCTPGTQLYVYVLGGNPGNGTNSALGLLAALGNCPAAGNVNTTVPYISINEISTIAAAYALAGFASDATHIGSSGTALAQTGIANAFLNATNLANIQTGAAFATTPAGNGTVPQNEIYTLADILGYCVNSNDSTSGISSECSTLFGYALSGGATGSTPTNTASAAINIAHNPGANAGNLYGLTNATSPYPVVGTYNQPNDFTIGLQFTGGGLHTPYGIAIDASGQAWVANRNGASVTRLSSLGAILSGSSGYTGGGLAGPYGIAVDQSGNVWVSNISGNGVTKISGSPAMLSLVDGSYGSGGPSNTAGIAVDGKGQIWMTNLIDNYLTVINSSGSVLSGTSGYTGGGLNTSFGIAMDGSGNAWVTNYGNNSISKFLSNGHASGTSSGIYSSAPVNEPMLIALDSSGDPWATDFGGNSVVKLSTSGGNLSSSFGFGYDLASPTGIAIDGAGNAWVSNQGAVSVGEISSAGDLLSGTTGYAGGSMNGAFGIAIDGSGDVWIANEAASSGNQGKIVELIGAAAPVITPICAGLPSTFTSNGASNLGTRP